MCRDGVGQHELLRHRCRAGKGIAGGSVFSWNWLPLFPIFIVYLISAVAETNRAPFDVAEGESEIVAGHHVEYSGFAFALFFLAEYIFMILIAALTSLMFLGGWLSPLPAKLGLYRHAFRILDVRENGGGAVLVSVDTRHLPALPLRPNHALGWKVLIPIGFAYIVILGLWMISPLNLWK